MNYINNKNFKLNNTAVTLGKFDGFHIGHMKLIEELKKNRDDFETVVFTFDTSPLKFVGIDNKEILSKEERIQKYDKLEIDMVIEYPFDKQLMHMSAKSFVADIIKGKLDAKKIIVGKDFRFGHNRTGNVSMLQELSKIYGYELIIMDKVKYCDEDVSSTRIKSEILKGNMKAVCDMLGYAYPICGEVVGGRKLGREMGFPTINQCVAENKVIPPNGVYASRVMIEGKIYTGVTNIGSKPTVKNDKEITVETHILNFDEDIYGKKVCVGLYEYMRKEEKFVGLKELKEQIVKDKIKVEKYFAG